MGKIRAGEIISGLNVNFKLKQMKKSIEFCNICGIIQMWRDEYERLQNFQ